MHSNVRQGVQKHEYCKCMQTHTENTPDTQNAPVPLNRPIVDPERVHAGSLVLDDLEALHDELQHRVGSSFCVTVNINGTSVGLVGRDASRCSRPAAPGDTFSR